MRKKLTSLVLAMFFMVGLSGVSMASKCKGTVITNENGVMTIQLKGECKAKKGDSVKIKVKSVAKVEGC